MTPTTLSAPQKQFLLELLKHRLLACSCAMPYRTLIDNGYVFEKHLGGGNFEYRPTQECIDLYEGRMNELEPSPYVEPVRSFEFGCE